MTENEAKIFIQNAMEQSKKALAELLLISPKVFAVRKKSLGEYYSNLENCKKEIQSCEVAIKALEEVQRWHTSVINPNIKNEFANTSTQICHNCDHKDEYIEELEAEVEPYRALEKRLTDMFGGELSLEDIIDELERQLKEPGSPHPVNAKILTYEDAEEQGLLLRLPCGIGADVYSIPSKTNFLLNLLNRHEEENRVFHQTVDRIIFKKCGWYMECDSDLKYGTGRILLDTSYGVTWFLTRAEAEAKLKEMEEASDFSE